MIYITCLESYRHNTNSIRLVSDYILVGYGTESDVVAADIAG